jgi:hypothetical protein
VELTKEQLVSINSTIQYIIEYNIYFEEKGYLEDEIFSEERIDQIVNDREDITEVDLYFPGHDDSGISVEEILELHDDIRSIKIVNNGHIKTKNRSIYIVSSYDQLNDCVLDEHHSIGAVQENGVQIKLINSSIIIGLVATKLEEYDTDYWGTYSAYSAIEFIYDSPEQRLDIKQEQSLIDSFIFEVSDSTGIALSKSEIHCPVDDGIDIEETDKVDGLRELIPSNEAMRYFVSAVQIEDPELKFLSFYKVLEHFSPVALKLESHELMRMKLDSPRSDFDKGDFIKSIFELSNSVQSRYCDEELIKSSFSKCFDLIGLFEKLPKKLKTTIKKQLKAQDINYTLDLQKAATICNMVAKVVYKTRNSVVHAKSNFDKSGDEIVSSADFDDLNNFMKDACSQTIRWYSRLPEYQKIEMIE